MEHSFIINLSGTGRQFILTQKPNTSYIAGKIAPDWSIVRPLLIEREIDDDGSFIISDLVFGIYGHGDTHESAHNDFVLSLIEYYDLIKDRATSDPFTKALFDRLRLFLQKDRSFLECFSETDENIARTWFPLNYSSTNATYRFNLPDAD